MASICQSVPDSDGLIARNIDQKPKNGGLPPMTVTLQMRSLTRFETEEGRSEQKIVRSGQFLFSVKVCLGNQILV